MTKIHNLFQKYKDKKVTHLGIGPMSKNCIDAVIEISNENDIPLMLIASRRQIDCKELGGGYVNNWSTEEFVNYIKKKDINSNIILCRDHGGPYQNNSEIEKNISIKDAMKSAKISYKQDIINDFEILHIDPSFDPKTKISTDEIISRVKELYEYCIETAKKYNKEIAIEIGTEEQSGGTNTVDELEYSLKQIINFCNLKNYPKPLFTVVQTGTKVMETKNIGVFKETFENFENNKLKSLLKICKKYGVYMKQHNTDYLEDKYLLKHPTFGIHAANVAPEYAIAETKKIFKIIEINKFDEIKTKIIKLCVDSNKWHKWAINSNKLTDYEKAILCCHYLFSNTKFISLKQEIADKIKLSFEDLDIILKEEVKDSIFRYIKNFNLI